MNIDVFVEPNATNLERMREIKRNKRDIEGKQQITFDCFNCIYPRAGIRVHCRLGLRMSDNKDKGMDLIPVMAGRTGSGCRRCHEFDDSGAKGG